MEKWDVIAGCILGAALICHAVKGQREAPHSLSRCALRFCYDGIYMSAKQTGYLHVSAADMMSCGISL